MVSGFVRVEQGLTCTPETSRAPCRHEALLKACAAVLDYSVNTTNPHFNNQLYGTADPVGVAGDWVTAVLNANAHTFEVAPVFTVMENELLAKFGRVIGGAAG